MNYGYANDICEELLRGYLKALERNVRDFIKRTRTPRLYITVEQTMPKTFVLHDDKRCQYRIEMHGFCHVKSRVPIPFRPELP